MQALLKTFALAAVRFYQAALRPLNPWACKFHPSCSDYALEAVERHGLGRGSGLALGRLLRCRPGVFGGYDPVPFDLRARAVSPVEPGHAELRPSSFARDGDPSAVRLTLTVPSESRGTGSGSSRAESREERKSNRRRVPESSIEAAR